MTYVIGLIYLALVYIRPGELVPSLAALRLPAVGVVVAGVMIAFTLLREPRRAAGLPNDACFLGFVFACALSNPFNGRFAAAADALGTLLPLAVFYLVIRAALRTRLQLQWLVIVLVALTLFQATSGIVQHWTGFGFGGSTAVVEGAWNADPDLVDGAKNAGVVRIRGTGIFGDPNDLAMSLVLVFPFLFTAVLSRDPGLVRRVLALAAIGILAYALFLTRSRGGFLGLAVLSVAYAYRRFGRLTAIVPAVVVVVVVLAGQGRLQNMDATEDSAQGRIQAWSAGLEMLKSNPVLGVGFNQYLTRNELVAHNSFVHVLAEAGLVGGFCFVGTFFWCLVGNGSTRNTAGAAASPLALDVWASTIGVIVCACFLSRQYSPVLYVPLAVGAARMSVEQGPDRDEPVQRWWDWCVLLIVLGGVVVAAYAAVRLLVVWSPF